MPNPSILKVVLLCGLLTPPLFAQSASLSLLKIDSPDPVAAGSALTYTITASNEGPDGAANAIIADPLPAGTTFASLVAPPGWICTSPPVGTNGTVNCSIATFDPGSAVLEITVTVDPSVPVGTVLTNTATLSSSTSDPTLEDNSASADTTVAGQGVTSVSITKVDSPDPVETDADLTYTLTANSNVARDTDGATVGDSVPSGTTFVSLASPAGWSCSTPAVGATGAISCTIAPFPQGDAIFTLVVHVAADVAGGTILGNTATLDVDDSGRIGSASATATTRVLSPALLTATKTVSVGPAVGAVHYSIVLTNGGAHAQGDNPGPELTDTLPPELTLAGATATSGTVATAGNTVTWNGSLAAGASVTIGIDATLTTLANGIVVANQAAIAYDADGDGTNEASGASDDPTTAAAGDPTVFTVNLPTVVVPTLDAAGLLACMLGLGGAAWHRLRRRSRG